MLQEHREKMERKEQRLRERREVQSQGKSNLSIRIDTSDEISDIVDDPFISLSEVGEVDPIMDVEHLLGSLVMDELDDLIEEENEGTSDIDEAIIKLKKIKLQKMGKMMEKFINLPSLIFDTGFYEGPGSHIFTMLNRLEKRVENRDTLTFNCDTCEIEHEMSVHKTCRLVMSDSMLNWRLNPTIKGPDSQHIDYMIQSGSKLKIMLHTLYQFEPVPDTLHDIGRGKR